MPYIADEERKALDGYINQLDSAIRTLYAKDDMTNHDGRLNYSVCKILIGVLGLVGAPKYHKFNAMAGVLQCIILELYRRLVAPYEDQKIKENGDIF